MRGGQDQPLNAFRSKRLRVPSGQTVPPTVVGIACAPGPFLADRTDRLPAAALQCADARAARPIGCAQVAEPGSPKPDAAARWHHLTFAGNSKNHGF